MFLCRAVADKVADHYQSGGNPDAARQLSPTITSWPTIEVMASAAHSALGIVLMGARPTEIREHAIAHKLGDIA